MALIFKPNVSIVGIKDPTIAAILAVAEIFDRVLRKDCIVTSCNDSDHGPEAQTLHDDGLAVDFRVKHLDPAIRPFVAILVRKALNANAALGHSLYDVVHEDVGTDNEHLHVEADPH